MGKYFGTDGIRGIANKTLTPEFSYKLGRVLGHVLKENHDVINVLIGRDTRISGVMLECALTAGLLSIGVNVMRLGVVSTPAVAYLTKSLCAQAGIMISASHNPYYDNGIKIFGTDGYKIPDDMELAIEDLIDKPDNLDRPINEKIGVVDNYFEGQHKYLASIQKTINNKFENLKIAIDCANGGTSVLAPHLFANLGAEVLIINNNPDGININCSCGSTDTRALRNFVIENKADIGFAFDGDGDRLVVIDEKGNQLNGDYLLYILGSYMSQKGILNQNAVVSTVMSNKGFHKALQDIGIKSIVTPIGDRNVLDQMLKDNLNLGGEQSGHIIYLDYSTTADGLLAAVQLLNVMAEKKAALSELTSGIKYYPQVLENIPVKNKETILANEEIKNKINDIDNVLGENGRLLVRPSGTEALIG